MTNEETIKEIENMRKFNYTLAPMEVFDKAISALTALEKIREEIELKEKTLTDKYGQQKYGVWTDDVLQIIDKYRKEQE